MDKVIEIFKGIATDLGMVFAYGSKDYLNLLQNKDPDDMYLFLESPLKQSRASSEYGIGNTKVVGKFYLFNQGTIDAIITNGFGETQGKFTENVKPLLMYLDEIENALVCNPEYSFTFTYEDVYNLFDINLDGLEITFEYNKY